MLCFHFLVYCTWVRLAWSGRLQGRMREQSMMGGGDEPKFACKRGMHLQLDKSLSDHHVVNPYAEDTEEHHFVLPHGVDHLETHRGPCSELVYGPPLFDADIRKRYWDPEEITPLDYLDGFIEVRCIRKGSSASLQVIQYSCREYLRLSLSCGQTTQRYQGSWGPQGLSSSMQSFIAVTHLFSMDRTFYKMVFRSLPCPEHTH
mmetsp:Transcript_62122/g.148046  ORF Transcript_62122/g.148046 Transcript_62122/m.148046 type:complete len:203 (+) Transcript_62122:67-675(+)